MASTGGTSSYSPLSVLTGTTLLPKTTTVAKPVTTVAKPAMTSAPISLSNPVLKPVSTMSGSAGSAGSVSSTVSRPSGIAAAPNYVGLDQALAQRYVAPAQKAQAIQNGWQSGTLLPIDTNSVTGEKRLGVPEVLKTAYNNLMMPFQAAALIPQLPGMMKNAMTGSYNPTTEDPFTGRMYDPNQYRDANILASLAMTGGMAATRPAGSLGMSGRIAIPTYEDVLRYAYNNNIEPTHLFQTAKGSTYASFPEQNSVRFKTLHPGHDPRDVGIQPLSVKTVYVDPVDALDIGGMLRTPEQAVHMIPHPTIPRTLALKRYADYGSSKAGSLVGQYPFEVTPQIGLRPVEIMPDGRIHFGNDIVDLSQY